MLGRLSSVVAAATPPSWLARAGHGRLLVLCYHDLRETSDFTSWLRVDVGRFAEHLDALSQLGRFVSPEALNDNAHLSDDTLHILITFDDGYANNLRLGADVLAQRGIPALFFVSTHHTFTGEQFWFDRVVTRVQAAGLERLDLVRFGLADYRFFPTDGARRWHDIQRLLEDMKRMGNPEEPQLRRVLEHLDREFGSVARRHEERFRPMTVSELQELGRRPQMFFGSHAHRHEILPRLAAVDLADSLMTSKRGLEDVLGRPIDALAYPNGDEDARVRAAAVAAGYRHGHTTVPGLVSRDANLLRIPRLLVGGYDTARALTTAVNTLLAERVTNALITRVTGGRDGDAASRKAAR